jgi:hypothetical protein
MMTNKEVVVKRIMDCYMNPQAILELAETKEVKQIPGLSEELKGVFTSPKELRRVVVRLTRK